MRSGLALLAVIALSGCERLFDVAGASSDGGGDGHLDVAPPPPDGPPGCITVGMNGSGQGTLDVPGFYQRCVLPGRAITLTGTLSTSDSTCDLDAIDNSVCAVVASDIEIQGTFDVVGPRPLVLVATGTIEVSGTLSVSSGPTGAGAGADWSACETNLLAGSGGDGGAGGSLDPKYHGGAGGASQGTVPGPVLLTTPYGSLHGGCQGGQGSPGSGSPTDSGGAVYLMATTIVVRGAIEANGADGAGGSNNDGGGYGGGSGGMIALDAATIAVPSGMLRATGGGGGGGGSGNGGGTMGFGGHGGPPGDSTAGFGGNGYAAMVAAFAGGPGTSGPMGLPGGGGGGGGGAGGILLFTSTSVGGSFDPPATQ